MPTQTRSVDACDNLVIGVEDIDRMNELNHLIVVPGWSTFVLFALLIVQLALSWVQAKKSRKRLRLQSSILLVAGMTIVFVREWFVDVPSWIDASLAIILWLLLLTVLVRWTLWFRRYLQESWRLEQKNNK